MLNSTFYFVNTTFYTVMYLLRLLSGSPSLPTDEIHLESKQQSCLSRNIRNMAENTLTSDGFLTKTMSKKQEPRARTDKRN